MHPLPKEALAHHIAILGKTGSGKSYTAQGIAEALLENGDRLCVIDPTGRWWGLRSNAAGKGPGYPVVVFGGGHADVPLSQSHGSEIAEIVGTSNTPAIIDTRQMLVGERTRFFTDFAETLLRKNKGPLTLIVDEAHLFAPQGRVNDPQSGKMLHAANNLVSLGRGIGLRIILISQRPAKLHKDSLTQVETLIALRLIAPQDRHAVEDWIGEWADPKEGKDLLASLPSLTTGTGWIWAPELGVMKKASFPKIKTYDSGKAPVDAEADGPVLAPIDLPAIQQRLGKVAEEAKANDPKLLKAEIASLRRTMTQAVQQKLVPDMQAVEKARAEGRDEGEKAAMASITEVFNRKDRQIAQAVSDAIAALQRVETVLGQPLPEPKLTYKATAPVAPRLVAAPRPQRQAVVSDGSIPPARQRILDGLALLESIGVSPADKTQLALFIKVSPTSGGYFNNLGGLRSDGLIEYPEGGKVGLTEGGRSRAAPPDTPPTTAELHNMVQRLLPPAKWKIVEDLIGVYPDSIHKDALAERIGVSPTSGGYFNNLGSLRSLGLIDYPSPGHVVALPILFLEGP